MSLNSNDSDENKQIVFNFDFDQPDRSSETEDASHSNSSTSLTDPNLRRTEIAPVPESLAIAPNRYYLSFLEDGDRWHVPIQITLLEGWLLLDSVCRERNRKAIFEIVRVFVGSVIAGDAA